MIENVIIVVHVLTALAIIGLILLQQGKGADAGASFGAGASQTVFGASGGGNVLTKGTSIAAALFFATSLGLAVYAKQRVESLDDVGLPSVVEVPAAASDSEIPEVNIVSEEVPQIVDPEASSGEEVPVVGAEPAEAGAAQ